MDSTQQTFGYEVTSVQTTKHRKDLDLQREHYRALLAEKLKDPDFRQIGGFPIGTDEAILAMSDPPFYTACPNPFIEEWMSNNATPYDPKTDHYHREPFAADVREGRGDPIYIVHSYHTKVPHKAIMRFLLHYTEPGDLVFDGFCGTGMTGIAAQMCGNRSQIESLGYKVNMDGAILDGTGVSFGCIGARKAVLADLSPAGTFITYNYNAPIDANESKENTKHILQEVENEFGWMYSTLHDATETETKTIAKAVIACQNAEELRQLHKQIQAFNSPYRESKSKLQVGQVNYTIWSDIFICPKCGGEIIFWDAAVDQAEGKVLDSFVCPSCLAENKKHQCERSVTTLYDTSLSVTLRQARQVPVLVVYSIGNKRYERCPDLHDLALIKRIDDLTIRTWYPTDPLPDGYNTEQPKRSHGLTHVHHFYTRRNLTILSAFRSHGLGNWLAFSALTPRATKMHRIAVSRIGGPKKGVGGATAGVLDGTLFVPSVSVELNVLSQAKERIQIIGRAAFTQIPVVRTTTQSSTEVICTENSIDYIFTDPPFGGNKMYSELSCIWESWLRVSTNNTQEVITNDVQHKGIEEYQYLMTKCFSQNYRMLKPGRWMTVEFSNSKNAVWHAIQEGLEKAGFVVADVRVLDKKQNSFKQVTSTGAVKEDLIISCYKPHHDFELRFRELQGKTEAVLDFVTQHLAMLPVTPINKAGRLEAISERTRFILYDRMLAYHVQRGVRIPLSAVEFYRLLDEQFVERDEMYFLNEQSARFDAVKAQGIDTEQLSIFVRDEKTAVQWVRSRLSEQPQTIGDLTPKFMQESREWESHEPRPELRDLLKEYFIETEGIWRVPNPDNEKDLEVIRSNALLRLFRDYTNSKPPLKVFRKQAVLEGFRHCWETNQYNVIVAVCEKIPDKVLQEIQEFVTFYDIAKDLTPTQEPQTAFVWE